jgi:hypothetical protein
MTPAIFLMLVGIVLVGCSLISFGRRDRKIDDHPLCAKCRFDLTGRPPHSHNCPECGSLLFGSDAIVVGHTRRRTGLILAGALVSMLGGLPLISAIAMSVLNVDPLHFAPGSYLIDNAAHDPPGITSRATAELYRRCRLGQLSNQSCQRLVLIALQRQANLSVMWNPIYGDIVETLHSNGRLSAADWQTYLAHYQTATLKLRPRVARGDPIPFDLRGEMRGANSITMSRGPSVAIGATVPGAQTAGVAFSGDTASTFHLTGYVSLSNGSWDHLQPGPQTAQITVAGLPSLSSYGGPNIGPLACQGAWTLLPTGQKSVKKYHDSDLAAATAPIFICAVETDPSANVSVRVTANRPPADLAIDVFLQFGKQEWKSSSDGVVIRKGQFDGRECYFPSMTQLLGHQVQIVLRPSQETAAKTVDIDRLLNYAFIIKNVAINAPKR